MFTSRLPKSTSARRPSGPGEGTTSFYASNIPVSVRKANLFTPQPSRSLSHSGLASTAGKSFATTADKRFQRPSKPVPDRDEQIKMFDNLVDFLKTSAPKNFPIPDAKRFFSSVSNTEVARLLEFLISRIDSDFKMTRLEVDVPEALTQLEYPFIRTVTKSALVSVTTRQAIVNLLVICNWLIETIKSIEGRNFDSIKDAETEGLVSPIEVGIDILRNPHSLDQTGVDASGDRLDGVKAREDEELNELYAEVEGARIRLNEILQVQQQEQVLREDIEKSADYHEKLLKYVGSHKAELEKTKQMAMQLEAENNAERRGLEVLVDTDDHDDESPELSERLAKFRADIQQVEQAMAAYEAEKTKRIEQVKSENQGKKLNAESLREKLKREETILSEELAVVQKRFADKKEENRKLDLARLDYLKKSLDNLTLQATSTVKRAQIEAERWSQTERAVKENYRVVTKWAKRLTSEKPEGA